jgi:hypothetical protein
MYAQKPSRDLTLLRAELPAVGYGPQISPLEALKKSPGVFGMLVQVEMLGLSRLITGQKQVSLDMKKEATYRDLVRALSTQYPALIGNVIQSDRESLQAPNIFNLNAKKMIQSKQMDHRLADELDTGKNDRIILMSISAGG